jgi:hypothetical protein
MPRRCRICTHPEQNEIERQLLLGEPYRAMSRRFGVNMGSLTSHKKHVVVIDGAPQLIQDRAAAGKTQHAIAAELGLPRKMFGELLKSRKDWQLAWEAGSAAHEQHLAELLETCAVDKNKKNPIPIMFALKSRYGWVEKQYDREYVPPQPNVMVVLPGSMPADTYLAQVKARRLPALKGAS